MFQYIFGCAHINLKMYTYSNPKPEALHVLSEVFSDRPVRKDAVGGMPDGKPPPGFKLRLQGLGLN